MSDYQYKLEYDQRVYEHWSHREEIFESRLRAKQALDRLHAYMEQMAENEPGTDWIRNISPIMRREVTYSEWHNPE